MSFFISRALRTGAANSGNGGFSAQSGSFVYIAPMAKISPITTVTNIRGTARAISLAITTKTTKTIIKTITIR
ncbi:MAG: hypothetical protein JO239_09390 [Paraburkholderia sp.]|nr:hypothetical protein [Paraburkholderia sp.]